MLRIASGHSADYLLNAVASGRENYYTGAVAEGEPPGRWYGAGAAAFGLAGEVDAQDMRALFEHFVDPSDPAFRDPDAWADASNLGHAGRKYLTAEQIYQRSLDAEPHADAERREELRVAASKAEQKNVAFLDATFSVQKSVTVLHTAFEAQQVAAEKAGRFEEAAQWATCRQAVEDAIWAGNRTMLDYLAEHAGYSRIGHHGGSAGRFIDAHDWTVTSFFQHDSRDRDPQLHIHNPILNRVRCADGKWRTLDGRSLFRFRGAAGAVGERVMEEFLTRVLGVRFATRPDGAAREIVGVDQAAMDLFSTRSRRIGPRTAELIETFTAEFGRAPNALERDRLAQTATLATRKAKSHTGQTREQMLREWDARLHAEITGGLATIAHQVTEQAQQCPEPELWSPLAVIETALAAVQAKKAAWTEPDLTREISNALPDHLGIVEAREMGQLLDRLTREGLKLAVCLDTAKPGDEHLSEAFLLANGESAFDAPGLRRYATPEHLHTERLLVAATARRDGPRVDQDAAAAFVTGLAGSGVKLDPAQAAAVRGILSSGIEVEALVGPAGTGKSFVVGALAKAWTDPTLWAGSEQRVVGLAASQRAADVLRDEGVTAANTARWLAAQVRLAEGRAKDGDHEWALRHGDLVVIDESSMADTTALAAVHERARAAGAKLLLVGDHRQLGAVGAGGGMDLLAEVGTSYELTEARRFHEQWEREASLRLRTADPAALEDYHRHGRILDGGAAEQAEQLAARRWLGTTLDGRHAILVVDTNEQAARLNADLRAELVALGRIAEHGVRLGRDGTWAGVGDLVQGRRLAWELAGYAGNPRGPVTREQYRVLETREDGSMLVAHISRTVGAAGGELHGDQLVLPARYVAEDLTLGYVATGHAAEGLTVDAGYTIATAGTRAEALYPAATRGRESNTIIVVTQTASSQDAESGETAHAIRRSPRAVLASVLERAQPEQSASTVAAESAAEAANIRTAAERLAVVAEHAVAERTGHWLDELVDSGALSPQQRIRLAAEDGTRKLGPILRRAELAGHDARAVLAVAVSERSLEGAQQLSNVLHSRIAGAHPFDPVGDRYRDRAPKVEDPGYQRLLDSLAEAADARQAELGGQVADSPPAWALEAFGPPPETGPQRQEWIDRAGAVAAQRELSGHDDESSALGPAPQPGQPEAYAAWRSAWRALGRPDAESDELEMSDGQLRMRIRAYQREQSWAPRLVTNELAATRQAADHQRTVAARRAAEADAATEPPNRERLQQESLEARALAETLDVQASQLEKLDETRALWLAHTAGTRAAYDRAQAELAARHAGDETTDQQVTAAEWLAAEEEAKRADDPYREITSEADLAEDELNAEEHRPVRRAGAPDLPVNDTEPAWIDHNRDVREVAEDEPAPVDEHQVRVPTADEVAESVRRAQRALAEIAERDAVDEARVEAERHAQVTRWHNDDQTDTDIADDGADQEPVREFDVVDAERENSPVIER